MDWVQFTILLVALVGMFGWLKSDISLNRTESSADRRAILDLIQKVQEEMKDFHGRLCAIEERNKEK